MVKINNNIKSVSLPRILAIIIYDILIIIAILLMATTLLFFILAILKLNIPKPHDILFRVYLASFIIAYYHLSWTTSNNGQTIGMKAWHVKIVNNISNKRISFAQTLLRIIGGIIGLGGFALGYIISLVNKKNKTLADMMSNTSLIQTQ